ncbi:MAG: hypothetical protein Q7T05_06870, partial [Dehalococcoidia bacterium]|nr:hypothetical protein [Dehalococcoidia bacterium]
MTRPRFLLIYALLVLIAVMPLVPSRGSVIAASSLTLQSSVQISFPSAITFSVKAQGTSAISKLRVHYTVVRQNFASVTSEGWAQ